MYRLRSRVQLRFRRNQAAKLHSWENGYIESFNARHRRALCCLLGVQLVYSPLTPREEEAPGSMARVSAAISLARISFLVMRRIIRSPRRRGAEMQAGCL